MRRALALSLTAAAVLLLLGLLLLVDARPGAQAAPATAAAPFASTEDTTTASPELRARALAQYRAARRAFTSYHRAAVCFRMDPTLRLARRPARDATAEVWLGRMGSWRHAKAAYQRKTRHLMQHILRPGGPSTGKRWAPLMRLVGFPESAIAEGTYIIQRESSGRPLAHNPSGASGLWQFMPGFWRGQWGYHAFNPFDPLQAMKCAYWVWHRQGHSYLPAWALTAY